MSYCLLEFTIQSQIFTKEFSKSKKKRKKDKQPVQNLVYNFSIGNTILKSWNANDDPWVGSEFEYHSTGSLSSNDTYSQLSSDYKEEKQRAKLSQS